MNAVTNTTTFACLGMAAVLTGLLGCADGSKEQAPVSQVPQTPVTAPIASTPRPAASSSDFALFGQMPVVAAPGQTDAPDAAENLRQVTFTTVGSDFDPDLDTKAQHVVFASTRHRHTSDIYLQKVDGSAVTQLTDDPGNDAMPTFSPDGTQIAFASDRAGNWDIYVMPALGGQPVQITNDLAPDIHPSFSPDGQSLVYCTQSTQSGQWEMVVVDLARPSNKRYIGPGLFPKWSPVDNRILFQRARERGTRWFSVWVIELINGEGVRPTELAASSNAACITPRWSPDARHIVLSTVVNPETVTSSDSGATGGVVRPRQADIWILNADGSGRTNLTRNAFVNVQPVWAADGQVYFVSGRDGSGRENIWSLRPGRSLLLAQPTSVSGEAPRQTQTPTQTDKIDVAGG